VQARDRDHPPDVELGADIQDDGCQDHEAEAGGQLLGEHGGLGEEARSDGGSRHQERGAEQGTAGGRRAGLSQRRLAWRRR
jgi:hypothetical protein